MSHLLVDDNVLTAARSNKSMIVSEWLQQCLKVEHVNTRLKLTEVLKQAAQCLSVDVITLFKPPGKQSY